MRTTGKFTKGKSGNPNGRPPGTGKVAKLRESIAQHVPEILERLATQAKQGDAGAARLLLERVLPPVKATEQPSPVSIPDGDLIEQGQAVLAAAGRGELTTTQASQLLAAFGSLAKLIETTELERRIKALEERNDKPE